MVKLIDLLKEAVPELDNDAAFLEHLTKLTNRIDICNNPYFIFGLFSEGNLAALRRIALRNTALPAKVMYLNATLTPVRNRNTCVGKAIRSKPFVINKARKLKLCPYLVSVKSTYQHAKSYGRIYPLDFLPTYTPTIHWSEWIDSAMDLTPWNRIPVLQL